MTGRVEVLVWVYLKIEVLVAIAEPLLQPSRFQNKSPLIVCSLNSLAFHICKLTLPGLEGAGILGSISRFAR